MTKRILLAGSIEQFGGWTDDFETVRVLHPDHRVQLPLLAVTVRRILCCTFLCAAFLSGHPSPYVEDRTESQKLARRFQDVAVRSMRDGASRRARTIDLYWRANAISGSGKPLSETRGLIGKLYRQLEGGRIVHAELDGPGWKLREP